MTEQIRTAIPDKVFDRLSSAILDGTYRPGERLPSQRALAADFGVNMASLRAAIDRLAQMRLIEVRHGEPMRVADWRSTGGVELLAHAVGSDPNLTRQVFEARAALLREAASLAAERASAVQRDQLTEFAKQFELTSDPAQRQLIDLAFMSVVIEAAGNLVFTLILNSIRAAYLARSADFSAMVDAPGIASRYRKVASAVARTDSTGAARAIAALADAQLEAMTQ